MTATLVPTAAPSVDELVRTHLPLVGHLVRETARRVPAHVNRDDLTSAAMYALSAAAIAFDPELGVPFGSFASLRIRGALTDELRALDWTSRSVRSRSRVVEDARDQLTQALGRQPSDAEVAAHLGMADDELARLRHDVHRGTVLYSDTLGPADCVQEVPDTTAGPESLLLRREQLGYLRDAIAELPDRLRTVVEQYFFGQRLMADIAADLGVTESRVSQLRSEALAMLRVGLACAEAQSETTLTAAPEPSRRRAAATSAYRTAVATRSTVVGRFNVPPTRTA